ncbi:Eco57I restriction-modification methylase domain-containing protein [Pseudoalteromonas rubra]|uniref:site-specific DNA-methyltransferase (adenine-specific) n=1 Tax=Pseudoalteromonas rubra TaxID=43658 RepID=A0A5S3X1V1_9GAMM|nr:N-6 DNA methylase [Pseudoalteromonas rubra]TMP38220.1 hypothetical protein CWB98_07840 [Pseudoalteromonas rubra]
MNTKFNGSFYTPVEIAEWLTERVSKNYTAYKKVKVLEPSCGDGVFLDTFSAAFGDTVYTADAVELNSHAHQLVLDKKTPNVNVYNGDFLFWETRSSYDLIIGNPPYIARKRLDDKQAEKCKQIHISNGLENKEISNIWTSFLIKSASHLSNKGILAFVLPTELLQVNYSKEIRKYLLDRFERLEIISFKSLAFEDIEQDTVILIAYKKTEMENGLYFAEVSTVSQLRSQNLTFTRHHGDHNAKWSSYILTEEDMSFLEGVSEKCKKVSDFCTSVAGIVTAANSYFILTSDDVKKYKLEKYAKKIVQRGIFINGSVEISESDYNEISNSGKPCYLIDLNSVKESEFSDSLMQYLKKGRELEIHQRYKCKLRPRWFDVPSIWKSEGLFFKRGHKYPKLVVNNADVYVTDSAYRIKMKSDYNIQAFAYSFYNSLTLLYSELNGRYYGGGVLELTPNEFKSLPVPYVDIEKEEFSLFSQNFKSKKTIEDLIKINDEKVLSSIKGLSPDDIIRVHNIYQKVKRRRLRES